MKKDIKTSASLFLKLVIAAIICFFLMLSFNVIFSGIGQKKEIGYVAYGQKGDGEAERLYTYYNSQGDDLKFSAYESQGYKIEKSVLTEMTKGTEIAYDAVTLSFSLIILIAIIYAPIWEYGFKDSNLVHLGHRTNDKWRGFKIGLIASIPHALLYLAVLILSGSVLKDFNMSLYKFASSYFFILYDFIFKKSIITAGEVTALQWIFTAIVLLAVPVISGVSYYLGLKEISIGEKLVYKNKGKG